jgi:hypothetical protein
MNSNSNTIENNNPAICEGCGAEYNGRYDDKWCEDCRFVDCKMCGECVHRDDVCPHGIDGGCNCECVCEECWHECGICYNLSASRPSQGFYCDHRVCGDCSNQITTCPFCRRPWDEEEEEEEDEEEEDPHEQCDICGRPATAGLIDDNFICVECRDEEE